MYPRIRPLLFHLPPETAHRWTLAALRLLGAVPFAQSFVRHLFAAESRPIEVFGLKFANPLGLAAGYEKDGQSWRGLVALGFGHIEIGTVTLRPQPGNPKPRLFRLVEDQGLINRLGFPSRGAEFVARHLRGSRPPGCIIGVNLGKNMDTPITEAASEYQALMELFAPLADYLVVNISSPNTKDLRKLQARKELDDLLISLDQTRQDLFLKLGKPTPLLVKLAPDLSDVQLEEAIQVIIAHKIDGVIIANTTLDRAGLRSPLRAESGGLSGAPLLERSLEIVARVFNMTGGALPIIGVGGILQPTDALRFLEAGASLIQVYTGLVYRGPGLVQEIISAANQKYFSQ